MLRKSISSTPNQGCASLTQNHNSLNAIIFLLRKIIWMESDAFFYFCESVNNAPECSFGFQKCILGLSHRCMPSHHQRLAATELHHLIYFKGSLVKSVDMRYSGWWWQNVSVSSDLKKKLNFIKSDSRSGVHIIVSCQLWPEDLVPHLLSNFLILHDLSQII